MLLQGKHVNVGIVTGMVTDEKIYGQTDAAASLLLEGSNKVLTLIKGCCLANFYCAIDASLLASFFIQQCILLCSFIS